MKCGKFLLKYPV